MVPYWHETKQSAVTRVMATVRQWLLVVLVGWVAGWQMMDAMLKHSDSHGVSGPTPVVAEAAGLPMSAGNGHG